MPYIEEKRRKQIRDGDTIDTAGELNFVFTEKIVEYLTDHGTSYQTINDIIGVLENCKLELYRRVIAPYEDEKIKKNGDVYETH